MDYLENTSLPLVYIRIGFLDASSSKLHKIVLFFSPLGLLTLATGVSSLIIRIYFSFDEKYVRRSLHVI